MVKRTTLAPGPRPASNSRFRTRVHRPQVHPQTLKGFCVWVYLQCLALYTLVHFLYTWAGCTYVLQGKRCFFAAQVYLGGCTKILYTWPVHLGGSGVHAQVYKPSSVGLVFFGEPPGALLPEVAFGRQCPPRFVEGRLRHLVLDGPQ